MSHSFKMKLFKEKNYSVNNYREYDLCSNTTSFTFGEQVVWKWFPSLFERFPLQFQIMYFQAFILSDKKYPWIFFFPWKYFWRVLKTDRYIHSALTKRLPMCVQQLDFHPLDFAELPLCQSFWSTQKDSALDKARILHGSNSWDQKLIPKILKHSQV